MNTKASITISRVSCSDERQYISIRIQDELSSIILADLEIPLDRFAQAVTGLHLDDVPCETSAQDARIGRKRIYIPREIEAPSVLHGQEEEWLMANYPEKPDPISFRRQHGSIRRENGTTIIRYHLVKWEEVE
jgi:hypothetical protein